MPLARRLCLCSLISLAAVFPFASRCLAEKLTISSTPPGATIEIDGAPVGVTPYTIDYPSSYFHKPHTVFSSRLEHALILKIRKEGYAAQQITLTDGPLQWISLNGKRHGNYFLLKTDHFEFKLEPISEARAPAPVAPPSGSGSTDNKQSSGLMTASLQSAPTAASMVTIHVRSQRRRSLCRWKICGTNARNYQHSGGFARRDSESFRKKRLAAGPGCLEK